MALKLLTPGREPFGQFDLDDSETTVHGGEWGQLSADDASDYSAADVTQIGPLTSSNPISVKLTVKSAGVGGLTDDGTTGYGTTWGTVVGGTVGRGTGMGTESTVGVVTVGPSTHFGSGKVTLWHAPGLYGVSGTPATAAGTAPLSGLAVNAVVEAETDTGFLGGAGLTGAVIVGYALGAVKDSSLVSTTGAAAGLSTATEFYALYLAAI